MRDRLVDLRDQAEVVLNQIEEIYAQADPAVEEAKNSAKHAATAASLAAELSTQPRHSKRPMLVSLVVLALAAFIGWKLYRRDTMESGESPH